jgi:hypothetical protein
MSLPFDTTDWYLQTSREFGESIAFISGAEGVLFFANDKTHQKLTVPYTYLSAVAPRRAFGISEMFRATSNRPSSPVIPQPKVTPRN